MATILDNNRAVLDARIALMQEEIDALQAKLDVLRAERRELDDFVPAISEEEMREVS